MKQRTVIMPTYVYGCESCGYTFEKFQSISAVPLKKCPRCGHMALHHLPTTGGGLVFKGSGFYETDYKKKPAPPEAKAAKK